MAGRQLAYTPLTLVISPRQAPTTDSIGSSRSYAELREASAQQGFLTRPYSWRPGRFTIDQAQLKILANLR